jgi:hypothetical protein
VLVYHLTPPQNIPSAKLRWKILASIFWDQEGNLLIDYLPKGQTIKAKYYSTLLVRLKDILKEKFRGKSLFLHDNARLIGTFNPEETSLPGFPIS